MQPPFQPPGGPPPYAHPAPGQAPYQQPGQPAFQPPGKPAPKPSPPTPPPEQRDVSVMDGLRFTTSGESGWNNILMCSLCYFSTQIIPIVGLIVMQGYFAEVHRRLVLRRQEPYFRFDFSDLSNHLSRGVAPFVLALLVALPFGIVLLMLVVALAVGANAAGVAAGLDEDVLVLVALGGGSIISLPLLVFWLALLNAATTRAELTGEVGKALQLGPIWVYAGKTWTKTLSTGILLWFVTIGLMIVGIMACVIGMFVTMTIVMIAQLHVRWQIYNDYLLKGGEPIELAPDEALASEAQKHQPPPGLPPGYSPPKYG